MRAPEISYRFTTAVNTAGPTLELFSRSVTVAAADNEFTADITGPGVDRILCLTNIAVEAIPGGALSVTRMRINAFTPGGLEFAIATDAVPAVASLRQELNWQGEVYIGGAGVTTRILAASVVFSANTSTNNIRISVFGFIIPKGNIAPY